MTEKYEKVEGMTVGQVVDEYMDSDRIYADYNGEIYLYHSDDWDLSTLKERLEKGLIYIKIEAPWWEGCEGSVIMVRDSERDQWKCDILKQKSGVWFECRLNDWNQARPLTQAEKDAIITEG